ncbi:MAG: hypothetical protein ACI9OJ_004374 [Myxococcota bacterium]|jgi:hypothetical protein
MTRHAHPRPREQGSQLPGLPTGETGGGACFSPARQCNVVRMRTGLVVVLACGLSVSCVKRYLVSRADLDAARAAPEDNDGFRIVKASGEGGSVVRLRTWRLSDGSEPSQEPGKVWVQTKDANTPLLVTGYALLAAGLVAGLVGLGQ